MLTGLIREKDQERIKRFVSVFLERCTNLSSVVPEKMRAGPTDKEGWTPWNAVDSPVDDNQILQLENEVGF
ncbi:MAG: hypothetical protein KDA84_13470, partial [Planctomycetaceae bacterium]|nr:hypothetical protein [Planctomycetaceae bacterium]